MTLVSEYEQFKESGISNIEYPFRCKDGRIIWCAVFGTPLDNLDLAQGIIWSLIDISEKKNSSTSIGNWKEIYFQRVLL